MTNSTLNGAPRTYLELVASFPPRSITSESGYCAVQEVLDKLLDKEELSRDEQDYLDILGLLVSDYERRQQVKIPDNHGTELLEALIEEHSLRQKDLVPIFKTESIASAILNGHRKLTVEHIQKLAEYFHTSPSAFFPLGTDSDFEES